MLSIGSHGVAHEILQGSDVGVAADEQSDHHPWMTLTLRRVRTRPFPHALRGSSIRVEM
jgi:hypothetical protein